MDIDYEDLDNLRWHLTEYRKIVAKRKDLTARHICADLDGWLKQIDEYESEARSYWEG